MHPPKSSPRTTTMASNSSSSIPKFASFKPKPRFAEQESGATSISSSKAVRSENHHTEQNRRGDRKSDDNTRSRSDSKGRRSRSRERGRKASRLIEGGERHVVHHLRNKDAPRTSLETKDDEDRQQSYFIDRRGDPDNIKFGGLHRRTIPPYQRFGYRHVLGMPNDYQIDQESSDQAKIIIRNTRQRLRSERMFLHKSNRPRITRDEFVGRSAITSDGTNKTTDDAFDNNTDYISIVSGAGGISILDDSSRKSGDELDYRDIQSSTTIVQKQPEVIQQRGKSDAQYKNEAGIQFSPENVLILRRNAELSRLTKSEPKNLQAWLNLINHQENMAQLGMRDTDNLADSGHFFTASELRSISEIKISIYEQALKSIGTNKIDQIKLLLGILEEGSKVWESGKLSKRWGETLRTHASSVDLWTRYIDYFQTDFIQFRYEEAKRLYLDCLKVVSTALQQSSTKFNEHSQLHNILIYVLGRLTAMMSEAGYREHAIAMWQAVFEFVFYRPSTVAGLSHTDLAASFEEFWEAELPRIGEDHSSGWSKFDSCTPPAPKAAQTAINQTLNLRDPFRSFHEIEEAHTKLFQYPGRTNDDDIDDPYHVILFSDIKPYLSQLPYNMPRTSLIEALLNFLGLPPLSSYNQLAPIIRDDTFFNAAISKTASLRDASSPSSDTNSFSERFQQISNIKPQIVQMTERDLFGDAFSKNTDQINVEFAQRILSQVVLVSNDEHVAEYYLALLNFFFPAEAAKVAKGLLKRMSSSLRLYNAYALIEASKGDIAKADMVFSTAIKMSITFSEERQGERILVLRSWVWETLGSNNTATAYSRLLSFASNESSPENIPGESSSVSPATILKSRQCFTEGRDNCFSNNRLFDGIIFAECLALFAYLQHGSDISSATEIFQQTSDLLTSRGLSISPVNQLNHQALATLFAFHLKSGKQFRPSIIRDELSKSIALFPTNTKLLSLFAANEARFRIEDRVRTIMQNIVLNQNQHNSTAGWMFAIHVEKQRGSLAGSTTHSVRALYNRAVESQAGKHSFALWKSFIDFEIANAESSNSRRHSKARSKRSSGQNSSDRLKQVYFRGLTFLPWCKEYMMIAFSPGMREILSIEDLKRVWNVMGEKEMRVFVDLEPVFDNLEHSATMEKVAKQTIIRLPDDHEL